MESWTFIVEEYMAFVTGGQFYKANFGINYIKMDSTLRSLP